MRDICGFAGHMRATTSQFQLRAVPASGVRYLPPSLPGKRNPAPLRYEQFLTSSCALPSLHIDSEPVSSITTEPRSSVVGVDEGLR